MRALLTALCAAAVVAGMSASTVRATTKTQSLQVAVQGLAQAKTIWWDQQHGWYDEYKSSDYQMPLVMLWSAYQVFNAVNGVAIADPTPAHKNAVRAFANGAEKYWNGNVPSTGAYAYYPSFKPTGIRYYFDDNGWFGLAFLDAYRVTHDHRYLDDAWRAWRFLAVAGWDPHGGGFWWENRHDAVDRKTSEPLAAGILIATRLYEYTHKRAYLADAQKWLAWANAHSWNRRRGLYQRNSTDPTVMSYVEGLMAAGNEELCVVAHVKADCARAELVARNSVTAFGTNLNWNPRYDAIYLYGLLQLYAHDHNARWYQLAAHNAQRALSARSANGLFLHGWDGSAKGEDTTKQGLGLHAASVSVFAWLAAESPSA